MGTGEPKSKKAISAAAIFFNKEGKMLIVKPSYRDYWLMPGGEVEKDESPRQGLIREIKEELNLDWQNLKLVAIDYVSISPNTTDALRFAFFAGVLSDEQISKIKLPASELLGFGFFSPEEAMAKLSDRSSLRIQTAFKAYKDGKIVYLEDGHGVM